MDLTDKLTDATKTALGGVLDAFEIDGKIYGVPTSVLPEGIWYSTDLFDQAGITETPTTIDELEAANQKLKEAGLAAHRSRREGRVAGGALVLQLRAARLLAGCRSTRLRPTARSTTPAGRRPATSSPTSSRPSRSTTASSPPRPSRAPGSSAGLLANHQAGMELMGAWDPGVIASLTPDAKAAPRPRLVPVPRSAGRRRRRGRHDGRRRRVLVLRGCSDGVRRLPELHLGEGQPGGATPRRSRPSPRARRPRLP